MLQKKVCMLGTSAVGKTSLVRRFVHGIFSDTYLTTIGVKIDKKDVQLAGTTVTLLLWDLYGEDRFLKLSTRYLRGAAGFLLVVDGTRRTTLDDALQIHARVAETLGPIPGVLLINKSDVREEWEVAEEDLEGLRRAGWAVQLTSAKNGTGVEEAFTQLAAQLVNP